MPPAPHQYLGPRAVEAFLRASARWRGRRQLRLVPTAANGQYAFGCYLTDPDGAVPEPIGMVVLTVAGDRISTVTRFLDPQLPHLFGLASPLG